MKNSALNLCIQAGEVQSPDLRGWGEVGGMSFGFLYRSDKPELHLTPSLDAKILFYFFHNESLRFLGAVCLCFLTLDDTKTRNSCAFFLYCTACMHRFICSTHIQFT